MTIKYNFYAAFKQSRITVCKVVLCPASEQEIFVRNPSLIIEISALKLG